MTQPWTPPSGNNWVDVTLLKRIGLDHELTFQEGDQNKDDAENSINWIGNRIMELLQQVAWQTGDAKLSFSNTIPSGWLLCDNRTMGSSLSGASLTGSVYEALYNVLWVFATNDDLLTSSGTPTTKGVSASADWQANKRIYLPRPGSRYIAIAGAGLGLTARSLGEKFGVESISYTPQGNVSQASVSGITATSSAINISGVTATSSAINGSSFTATSSAINGNSFTATCGAISIASLTSNVVLSNDILISSGADIPIDAVTCVNVSGSSSERSVIQCATLTVKSDNIAEELTTNVGVSSATIGGSIPSPTITMGGSVTPTITMGGSTTPTITIGGSIPTPTITIAGSIATQTFTGTSATIPTLSPAITLNLLIKI